MSQTGPTTGAALPEPLVSVVIPTRNRWETLEDVGLRSALAQLDVAFEVVVVDDHSDSAPPEGGLLADSRVRLIRVREWGGVAAARNAGIEQARGDWVAFLDDDDLWSPNKLAAVVGAMQQAEADFGYSSVLEVNAAWRPLMLLEAVPAPKLRAAMRDGNGIYAVASNIVVRRTLLKGIGGFDETLTTAADWDIVQRLVRGGRPGAVSAPLVAYRPSGWLLADEPTHRTELKRLEGRYEDLSINWKEYERWIALSLHRAGRRREAAGRYLSAAKRFGDLRSLLQAGSTIIPRDRIDRLRRPRGPQAPEWLAAHRGSYADVDRSST